ncbi:MAG TPA: hypothetical protein DCE56_33925 [Cyanobacteria bacterium UBA8553]|nr:hypothetical protein [Cyanobacteria bacterium UBA8553]
MAEASKYNLPSVQKLQVFEQVNTYIENNNPSESRKSEALNNISQLLENLHQQHPQASDAEILDIITRGFEIMPQNNPKQWQRWQDTLSVVFAGGIEAVKVFFPAAGIPIEVGKRLYEIYDRNRKQLPSS